MMKTQTWFALTLIGLLLIGSFSWMNRSELRAPTPGATHSTAGVESAMLRDSARVTGEQKRSARKEVSANAAVSTQVRFEKFERRLKEFRDSFGAFDMAAQRAKLIAELASDRDQIERAVELTENEALAREVFGERQAEARVIALRVLVENARVEGPERLEAVARKVADDVMQNPDAHSGRSVDFTDLVEGWIRSVGIEKVVENPHLLRDRMVIRQSLLIPYLRAFEYVYGERFKNPEFPVRKAFEEGLANAT